MENEMNERERCSERGGNLKSKGRILPNIWFFLAIIVTYMIAKHGVIDKTVDFFLRSCSDAETVYSSEYVDMGLSVDWATCNLGATSSHEAGLFYAWGETETKDYFGRDNYKWYGKNGYDDDEKYGVGGLTRLASEDDAAFVHLGEGWHLPTVEQWEELMDTTNCTWVSQPDSVGFPSFKVTSKITGNSIVLPWFGSKFFDQWDEYSRACYYYSADKPDNYNGLAWVFAWGYLNQHDINCYHHFERYGGYNIRPVHDKK